jgi:hypothetical protein
VSTNLARVAARGTIGAICVPANIELCLQPNGPFRLLLHPALRVTSSQKGRKCGSIRAIQRACSSYLQAVEPTDKKTSDWC